MLGRYVSGVTKEESPFTPQNQSKLTWLIRVTAGSSLMVMLPWSLQTSMTLGKNKSHTETSFNFTDDFSVACLFCYMNEI